MRDLCALPPTRDGARAGVTSPTPITEGLRSRLLAAASSHVLEHGLAGLSLSALSRAIGSSNRMLLYHFGSLDGLIAEVVASVVERGEVTNEVLAVVASGDGSLEDRLDRAWAQLASPALRGARELFFGYFGQVVHRLDEVEPFAVLVRDTWTAGVQAALRREWGRDAHAQANAIVALWRGLQMDLLAGAAPEAVASTHRIAVRALLAAGRPARRTRSQR